MPKKTPNPVDQHVGRRVRMRRKMLEISQQKLGDALGLTFQQVQKYEKGTNRIGASRMQQLSQILEVPVAFFYEGAPSASVQSIASASALMNAPSPAIVTEFLSSPNGVALTRAFLKLGNERVQRRVVALVEEMADAA
jgi:transcriptional regulator with XRE-family HTH domain